MRVGVFQLLQFPDFDHALGALIEETENFVINAVDLLPVALQVVGHIGNYFLPEDSRSKAGVISSTCRCVWRGPSGYPTGSVKIFATIDPAIQGLVEEESRPDKESKSFCFLKWS